MYKNNQFALILSLLTFTTSNSLIAESTGNSSFHTTRHGIDLQRLPHADDDPLEFTEELRDAILREDTAKLKETFSARPGLEIFDDAGNTPLMVAADGGKLKSIKTLIELGADTETRSRPHGYTAFLMAILTGRSAAVKLLKEFGANPEAETYAGHSGMMLTLLFQDEVMMKTLKDLGIDANRRSKKLEATALMLAAKADKAHAVRVLHELGAKLELTGPGNSITALSYAASKGSNAAIKALIELGANLEAADEDGFTAIFYAVRFGHIATMQILLAAGAKTEIVTSVPDRFELSIYAKSYGHDIGMLLRWENDRKFVFGLAAAAIYQITKWTTRFLARPPSVSAARKIQMARAKREFEAKKADLKKSFQSPFHARPSFSAGGEFLPLLERVSDFSLQEYLDKIEKDHLENLAYESVPLVYDDNESEVQSVHKTMPKTVCPAREKPASKQPKESLVSNKTLPKVAWEDIRQTRNFGSRYHSLTAVEQKQLHTRIRSIVEEGRFEDVKYLSTIRVVVDGKTILCHLYELRFHSGMRIYATSIDGKSIHLLLIGDKKSQQKDIQSLKGDIFL